MTLDLRGMYLPIYITKCRPIDNQQYKFGKTKFIIKFCCIGFKFYTCCVFFKFKILLKCYSLY